MLLLEATVLLLQEMKMNRKKRKGGLKDVVGCTGGLSPPGILDHVEDAVLCIILQDHVILMSTQGFAVLVGVNLIHLIVWKSARKSDVTTQYRMKCS